MNKPIERTTAVASKKKRVRDPKDLSLTGLGVLSVVLSYLALLFESTTHICAENFFDPIPTFWHGLLVFSVPTTQLFIAGTKDPTDPRRRRWLGAASGLGIGASCYYSLMFLPLLPGSVIGILIGLGLLSLSPFFALLTSIRLHLRLRRAYGAGKPARVPGLWIGLAAGLLFLPLTGISLIATNYAMRVATSNNPGRSARGLAFLRSFGNEKQILRSCYGTVGQATDPISSLIRAVAPVRTEEARAIHYRVTGRPFNSVEPPPTTPTRRRKGFLHRDPPWIPSADLGGTEVSGRSSGLQLAQSRIDGKIDAAEATAYTEWILTFRNDSRVAREARVQILLPQDSVVSRLTLWIDGEEREAAFAGRRETREAYRSVVERRRDPVLVTTSGPDLVLVQCFPVPASGGTMKIRLGITSPLCQDEAGLGTVGFPSITERNFEIEEEVRHSIWIESTHPFRRSTDALTHEKPEGDAYTARGDLDEQSLADPRTTASVELPERANLVWTDQSFGDGETVVLQRIVRSPITPPTRVMLVVDGSATMESFSDQIARSVELLPASTELGLVFAGDTVGEILPPAPAEPAQLNKAAQLIRKRDYIGGMDLVPALVAAWERCSERAGSVILLVHGPQPADLSSLDPLKQRMERRAGGPRLITVRAARGPNRLLRQLEGNRSLSIYRRKGGLETDLNRMFEGWNGGQETRLIRSEIPSTEVASLAEAIPCSRHVARLWANENVLEARRTARGEWLEPAISLAAHYKIVTPVSGAVVLETAEQYERAGLEPGDTSHVPSVPEPEMILLLLITLGAFALAWHRRGGSL